MCGVPLLLFHRLVHDPILIRQILPRSHHTHGSYAYSRRYLGYSGGCTRTDLRSQRARLYGLRRLCFPYLIAVCPRRCATRWTMCPANTTSLIPPPYRGRDSGLDTPTSSVLTRLPHILCGQSYRVPRDDCVLSIICILFQYPSDLSSLVVTLHSISAESAGIVRHSSDVCGDPSALNIAGFDLHHYQSASASTRFLSHRRLLACMKCTDGLLSWREEGTWRDDPGETSAALGRIKGIYDVQSWHHSPNLNQHFITWVARDCVTRIEILKVPY